MGFLNPRALRWKIAALAAAACCAVAAVIGVLVHDATWERSLGLGAQRAGVDLRNAEAEYARTGTPTEGTDVEQLSAVVPPLARALADRDRPGDHAHWYDDRKPVAPWMWAAVTVGDRALVTRVDMGADVRSLAALDRSMVKAGLVALAFVIPLAALATEPVNRRLRHGARTARAIAGGDLDARIGRAGRARDEITEMSAAVDAMAGALQRRLEAEKRFTADVAHELRTPLMGLTTAAGLLPEDDEPSALVQDRARALHGLVEDLLEISRLDAGGERPRPDAVPLGEFVADVVARTGVPARVEAAGARVVETDPRRVERIVVNLLTNARRHGGDPVEVTVTGARIAVRDHGPGFPAALLADGPQRFRTGAAERGRGHGLGLTIAAGQAAVLGARLTFGNAADGGALATLDLDPAPGPASPGSRRHDRP